MNMVTSPNSGRTQRVALFLLAALCISLMVLLVLKWDCPPNSIPAYEFEQHVLYTWNVRSGDFCFALMIQAKGYEFRRRWFPKRNAKCGVADLKLAIAALPRNSFVLWQDSSSKGFNYPSETVVADMIEFAKDHGVRLQRSMEVE